MDYTIISVDSMKGGVGKTTAALNLSALLLDEGSIVLLVDVDITGTNIVYGLESPYWAEKVNPISIDKKSVNLLNLFQEVFMKGIDLPRWCTGEEPLNNDGLVLKADRINIIGSEIYRSTNVGDKKECENKIFNPSILFDELHTFWFMECLKYLCNSFAKTANTLNNNKKIVIVIDNSPGFIGINPAIQEWLTDLGPIVGKFLTISSLDNQDLISCSNSIENLHDKIKAKMVAANKYHEMLSDASQTVQAEFKGETRKFFLRLLSDNIDSDTQKYYCEIKNVEENRYLENPDLYQAIIINKVPIEIKTKLYNFDFSKIWSKTESNNTIQKILVSDETMTFKNFIYYDESMNYQFMESSLIINSFDRGAIESRRIINSIERYNKKYDKKLKLTFKIPEKNEEIRYFAKVHKEIDVNQKFISNTIEKLKAYKLQHIARLIEDDLYPIAPIIALKQKFYDIIESRILSVNDFEIWKEDDDIVEKEQRKDLFNFIERGIENNIEKITPFKNDIYDRSFYTVVYLTISTDDNNNSLPLDEMIGYLKLVKSIQKTKIEKANVDMEMKKTLVQFLVNENLKRSDINTTQNKEFLLNLTSPQKELAFIDLYNTYCFAQARIIDQEEDFRFLIYIIRKSIMEAIEIQKMFFPDIKAILKQVIMKKTISHSEAYTLVEEGLKKINYMNDFQTTLRDIVNKWGIL